MHLNENLKWDEHVNELSISCDGVLRTLRKLKNFTNFKLRKQLAESLILYKLDYCQIIFNPISEYLVLMLQRVIIIKYVRETKDLVKIGWLPVKGRRQWNLLKATHQALYSDKWPTHTSLTKVNYLRTLRSSSAPSVYIPLVSNTLGHARITTVSVE